MSRNLVDQDWQTDALPFTAFSNCSITTTNAIDGTDLRCGISTATDGYALYVPADSSPDTAQGGSARALKIQGGFKFKNVTRPVGGSATIVKMNNAGGGWPGLSHAFVRTDGKIGVTVGAVAEVTGATVLGVGTVYQIDIEASLDASQTYKLYINGALEITTRGGGGTDPFDSIQLGLQDGSGKITWEHVFGTMKWLFAHDPQ